MLTAEKKYSNNGTMARKIKDVKPVSSSSNTEKELDTKGFIPRTYEVHGTGRRVEGIKPIEVEVGLVRSFDSDPLYSALISVCIERGYIRIHQTQLKEAA